MKIVWWIHLFNYICKPYFCSQSHQYMDNNESLSMEHMTDLQAHEKLQLYLIEKGIKYSWLSSKLGFQRSWCTDLFAGKFKLTKENQEKIEALLNIKL